MTKDLRAFPWCEVEAPVLRHLLQTPGTTRAWRNGKDFQELSSNLGRNTGYPEICLGFPQPIHVNTEIVHRFGHDVPSE